MLLGCLPAHVTLVIILTIVEEQKEWGILKISKYNWNCQQEQNILFYSEHLILLKKNRKVTKSISHYFCLLHHLDNLNQDFVQPSLMQKSDQGRWS